MYPKLLNCLEQSISEYSNIISDMVYWGLVVVVKPLYSTALLEGLI